MLWMLANAYQWASEHCKRTYEWCECDQRCHCLVIFLRMMRIFNDEAAIGMNAMVKWWHSIENVSFYIILTPPSGEFHSYSHHLAKYWQHICRTFLLALWKNPTHLQALVSLLSIGKLSGSVHNHWQVFATNSLKYLQDIRNVGKSLVRHSYHWQQC